jgi:hypothetical protein
LADSSSLKHVVVSFVFLIQTCTHPHYCSRFSVGV